MDSKFIELTNTDGIKILVNTLYIGMVEPHKNGTKLILHLEHYSLPKKVMESYSEVKAML